MKLLLLGCGIWGANILRDLVRLGCGVHVIDPSSAARAAAAGAGAESVAETLPKDTGWDGVVVATPASRHGSDVEAVLRYGVPVFVEKPMTVNRTDAVRLCDLEGPPVFVMHTWRYHAGILRLGRLLQDGELGGLQMLRSTRMNWTSPRVDVDPIWTLLPHDISIALEILGGTPRPVFAEAEMRGGKPVGMFCVLEHDGVDVIVEVSTRSIEKRREVSLRCEGGVAVLPNDREGYIEVLKNDEAPDARIYLKWPLEPGALYRELEVFVNYLQGGEPPKCTAHTGAAIVDAVVKLRVMAGIK